MLPVGARIEYFRRGIINKRWYFRFVAPNNEIIAQSEGYVSKANMISVFHTYFPEWKQVFNDRSSR